MFVDSRSRIDHEGLRTYVLSQLTLLKEKADVLCIDKLAYWQELDKVARKKLFGKDQDRVIALLKQLKDLPSYISGWINVSVDSKERFDFFVLTKAHELNSGDKENDYYWALQIRHDQLVALVRVLELLLDKMTLWTNLRPEHVFDDPVFSGLTDYGVEDQVYLEAENVYKERVKLVQGN